MTDLFSNEQGFFTSQLSNPFVTEYPCTDHNDPELDWFTAPFQMTPDVPFALGVPCGNALGLSGMNGHEDVWTADLFSSATGSRTSNQSHINTQSFNPSISSQFSLSDSVVRVWQPPAPYYSSVCREEAAYGAENVISYALHPVAQRETHPAWISSTTSVDTSRSLAQPGPPRSLRHAPYHISPDSKRRSASPASTHRCQWFDGAGSCGAAVAGTKSAIGKHMLAAHSIRLKAGKTSQVCYWQKCQKTMRRESIARHILAVHMHDRVSCPRCGSRFARTDSLQRHLRTQCPSREAASGGKEGA